MSQYVHSTIRCAVLLSVIGCAPEPDYTVSDGIYVFHFHLKGAKSDAPYRSSDEEYQLRFAEDGSIEFLDLQGRKQRYRGTMNDNQVELTYNFEGMKLQGTGAVTGDDRMEGSITGKLLEVNDNSTRYRQVFEAEWSLVKKQ